MITEKLKNIPQFPGCYLFKDDKDQIIYVGMSKFLPKRVTSYFQKNHDNQKTKYLVEQIKDVDFEDNHAQIYEAINDRSNGDLMIGNSAKHLDASGKEHKKWVAIASFPAGSYQYVMQIP